MYVGRKLMCAPKICLAAVWCIPLVVHLLGASANAQTIQNVRVFRATDTPGGDASFYVEITGQNFPDRADLRVFVAPQRGLSNQPQIVSATNSLIGVRFTATMTYFPATVGVAGPNSAVSTFDVPTSSMPNSDEPRIDDVELLSLDREKGMARIKIDGVRFGNDPGKIKVVIVPHNPKLAVTAPVVPTPKEACPTQTDIWPAIRVANDRLIIAEFSFPCGGGYTQPFRIARVLVTVQKTTLAVQGEQSFSGSYEMVPRRDKNLVYRYTVLSTEQARSRFGGGIAKNFYAVQLSIINNGSVKVQVPRSSIQAEVEWTAGQDRNTKPPTTFVEGPSTVSPVPLDGAVSFFSHDRKASGRRAWFFNTLQGLTTIGSAIQLFFGRGFAQGVGIAGGGFRNGLQAIFPDLSEEQLANLTSQSFESVETISGNGGSIEKVIFIQRGREVFESFNEKISKVRRLVTNILGFEIIGYEVPETSAKAAMPQE